MWLCPQGVKGRFKPPHYPATSRIRHLQASPAGLRFLSLEPLLGSVGPLDLSGISWVIVGGESGPGARLMTEGWVLDIRDQCARVGVAFFFKQWGGARARCMTLCEPGRPSEAPLRLPGQVGNGRTGRREGELAAYSAAITCACFSAD